MHSRITHVLVALALSTAACSTSSPRTDTAPPTVTATTIQPKVHFPAADAVDRDALAALPAEAQRNVPRSPVPVLVPKGQALTSVVLMVDAEYYALHGKLDGGATVHVQGTRARVVVEGVTPAPGNRVLRGGLQGHVTENEGIRVASWMENEVAYSVDLACHSPDDPPCADDKAVIALANSLVYVGGGER